MRKKGAPGRNGEGKPFRAYSVKEKIALREVVLAQVALGKSLTASCLTAGVNWGTFRYWRKHEPEFDAQVEEAVEAATDRLEDEAFRRAHDGVQGRPVFNNGEIVGYLHEYSDRLLETLLRARRPDKYRENKSIGDDKGVLRVIIENDPDVAK